MDHRLFAFGLCILLCIALQSEARKPGLNFANLGKEVMQAGVNPVAQQVVQGTLETVVFPKKLLGEADQNFAYHDSVHAKTFADLASRQLPLRRPEFVPPTHRNINWAKLGQIIGWYHDVGYMNSIKENGYQLLTSGKNGFPDGKKANLNHEFYSMCQCLRDIQSQTTMFERWAIAVGIMATRPKKKDQTQDQADVANYNDAKKQIVENTGKRCDGVWEINFKELGHPGTQENLQPIIKIAQEGDFAYLKRDDFACTIANLFNEVMSFGGLNNFLPPKKDGSPYSNKFVDAVKSYWGGQQFFLKSKNVDSNKINKVIAFAKALQNVNDLQGYNTQLQTHFQCKTEKRFPKAAPEYQGYYFQ